MKTKTRYGQSGAALVIALILLLVTTLLAVSGLSSSTLDLAMVSNGQEAENAFQAAESAIEAEFFQGASDPDVPRVNDNYIFGASARASATTTFEAIRLPPEGYSLTEYRAEHFRIRSTGSAARAAQTTHEQGFFVVVPGAATP